MADYFNLQMSIDGEKQVSRRLLIAADGVEDYELPLQESNDELQKSFQLNFSSQGKLFGGWPERKPQYKNGVRVDDWPLLDKSGTMKGNFVGVVTPVYLSIYNPTEYFPYHQSNEPRQKIPRRVMMKIDRQRRDYIVRAFQKYLVGLTR